MPPDVLAAAGEALARRTLELEELAPFLAPPTPGEAAGEAPGEAAGAAPAEAAARRPTVAAYVSMGSEPPTGALLDRLRDAGVRVLLPVLMPDNDLDWAPYEGADRLVPAGWGLHEPAGERLGPQAVAQADVVLLPGLAVDRDGVRLGRGGGSYDRVLERLDRAGAPAHLVVLLFDAEVLDEVPAEPHDRRVHAAVTPSGVHRFRH
ncbi:5-formyltetrahydrofolate cyclo-ligase [Streptomyces sp. NPDC021749]|uniref:5-formyltetrahydrofolate cyclo-ligase n=1 Tax=Streptomyces sp. NPDC021749 TaxID=3154905 RepID=UPI0033F526FE